MKAEAEAYPIVIFIIPPLDILSELLPHILQFLVDVFGIWLERLAICIKFGFSSRAVDNRALFVLFDQERHGVFIQIGLSLELYPKD